ncbi:hypothetical protein ACERIT_00690 [Halopenitus sp. H-Gu1]
MGRCHDRALVAEPVAAQRRDVPSVSVGERRSFAFDGEALSPLGFEEE